LGERAHDVFEVRPPGHFDHGLGTVFRQLAESRAEAAGEDGDLHRAFFTFRAHHKRLNVQTVLFQRCSVEAPIRSRYSMGMSMTLKPRRYGMTSMSTGRAGPRAFHVTCSSIDLR